MQTLIMIIFVDCLGEDGCYRRAGNYFLGVRIVGLRCLRTQGLLILLSLLLGFDWADRKGSIGRPMICLLEYLGTTGPGSSCA